MEVSTDGLYIETQDSLSVDEAKAWLRRMRVGEERSGLIGSSQARRLAALGLHVELKPSIAEWMLAPSDDFRSSNMLETIPNQYQIQGLELDWTTICCRLLPDLRRTGAAGRVDQRSSPSSGRAPYLLSPGRAPETRRHAPAPGATG